MLQAQLGDELKPGRPPGLQMHCRTPRYSFTSPPGLHGGGLIEPQPFQLQAALAISQRSRYYGFTLFFK